MNPNKVIMNEILLSDSSDESNEEDVLFDYLYEKNERPKIEDFEEVVDRYNDEKFRENFRMYRTTFNYILNLIETKITKNLFELGRQTISGKTQLLLAIWYFATPDSYRSICNRFNIGKATGLRSVRRVTNALLELSNTIITWPTGDYAEEVKNKFMRMGFPNTIGCIDGSYIPIPLPREYGMSYTCRKNFAAIILQGTCDHRLLFTHCYAGEVGSVHDSRVLRKSEIWGYMFSEAIAKFANNTHLIGDKAYSCMEHLLTPYKNNGHLTREKINYNYRFSSAEVPTIERAFGLLSKRMRCFKFLDVRCIDWVPKYIIACCVLHNICILQEDVMDLDVEEIEDDQEDEVIANIAGDERRLKQRGIRKREDICAAFARN